MDTKEIVNRRGFFKKAVKTTGIITALGIIDKTTYAQEKKSKYPLRISSMDGTLRQRGKVKGIEDAYKAGLDGLQVQFIPDLNNPDSLRHKSVQIAYRDAALQYGVQINALCIRDNSLQYLLVSESRSKFPLL